LSGRSYHWLNVGQNVESVALQALELIDGKTRYGRSRDVEESSGKEGEKGSEFHFLQTQRNLQIVMTGNLAIILSSRHSGRSLHIRPSINMRLWKSGRISSALQQKEVIMISIFLCSSRLLLKRD
jgi:hypothetical protein